MLGEASWMLTVTSTAKVPWSSAIGAISTRPDPVPDTAVKTAWAPSGEAVAAVDGRSRPTSPARQAKSRATRREMRLYIAVLPPPGAGIVDIWELIASSFSRRVVEVRIPVGPVTLHGCCSVFGWRLGLGPFSGVQVVGQLARGHSSGPERRRRLKDAPRRR